jgi:catechol 2,3-dioxygenase-like lactoylglutathione lyase family enzyme
MAIAGRITPLSRSPAVPNIYRVTPFMHVPDFEAALHFFIEILGFTCYFRADKDKYAYVQREEAAFRILENVEDDDVPSGNRRFAYYCDVEDLGALLAELGPKLATLPEGDVHGPRDQPYGQRELIILAPDGNLLVFGQSISA